MFRGGGLILCDTSIQKKTFCMKILYETVGGGGLITLFLRYIIYERPLMMPLKFIRSSIKGKN